MFKDLINQIHIFILLTFSIFLLPAITSAAETPGTIPGDYYIDSNGQSVYSMSIEIPAGISDMKPELGFKYNSNYQEGLLGMGWSLTGIQSITRGPSTRMKDGDFRSVNLTDQDRFMLNGEFLIALTGQYGADCTSYRTEIDNFTKVVSFRRSGNGPLYFKAFTKSGLIMIFGTPDENDGTNARIYAQGRTDGTIMAWPVSEIRDRAGNMVIFRYGQDRNNGEYWPSSIDYKCNKYNEPKTPSCSVMFEYENRPDKIVKYIGGSVTNITRRLTHIKTYCSGSLIRDYYLRYNQSVTTNRSRLVSVMLTAYKNGSPSNFPATLFGWSDKPAGFDEKTVNRTGFTGGSSYPVGQLGDFNGDGKIDLLAVFWNDVKVWLSNGSGYDQGSTWVTIDGLKGNLPMVGDFNGDGKTDIAVLYTDGKVNVHGSLGNAFGSGNPFNTERINGTIQSRVLPLYGTPYVADFDGDGGDDFLGIPEGSSTYCLITGNFGISGISYRPQLDTGVGPIHNVTIGDFNGDKKADFLASDNNGAWHVWYSGINRVDIGNGTASESSLYKYNIIAADVNGDDKDDIIEMVSFGYFISPTVRISTGTGFLPPQMWSVQLSSDNGEAIDEDDEKWFAYVKMADVNCDRKTDLLVYRPVSGGFDVYAYTNYQDGSNVCIGRTRDWKDTRIGDFNGDKMDDIISLTGAYDYNGYNDYVMISRSDKSTVSSYVFPDMITSISNGLNENIDITYRVITDNKDFYVKGTGNTYCTMDFMGPLYVVSLVKRSNGLGDQLNQYSYTYSGAVLDLGRRRFQGFDNIRMHDWQTNIDTFHYFNRNFPFNGMVERIEVKKGYLTLRKTVNTLKAQIFEYGSELEQNGDPLQVNHYGTSLWGKSRAYNPYIETSVKSFYSIPPAGNKLIKQITTEQVVRKFGYLMKKTVTTETPPNNDKHVEIIDYDYYDLENYTPGEIWLIGLPMYEKKTVQYNSSKPIVTRTDYDYYPNEAQKNCYGKIKTVEVEKNESSDLSLKQKTTYTYDQWGNVYTVEKKEFTQSLTRTFKYTHSYDPASHTVVVTDPMNHNITYVYNDFHGEIGSITDPNGLTTTTEYDAFGRKFLETRPDHTYTLWTYEASNLSNGAFSIKTQTSGKPDITEHYDMLGRNIYTTSISFNGDGIIKSSSYDEIGRMIEETRFHFFNSSYRQETSYIYDDLDRVIEKNAFDTGKTTFRYNDEDGVTTTVTNQKGQVTRQEINAMGLISQVKQKSDSIKTKYFYDSLGNLTESKIGLFKSIKITYDRLGRKRTLDDPDMGTWTYEYNGFGEIISQKDARGNEVQFGYDGLGRMTGRTAFLNEKEPGKCFTSTATSSGTSKTEQTIWTYDTASWGKNNERQNAIGVLSEITVKNDMNVKTYSENYTYDEFCRPKTLTKTIDGTKYVVTTEYEDNTGRIKMITYPASVGTSRFSVMYDYTSTGYMKRIYDSSKTYWEINDQNAMGQITKESLGNGLITTTGYFPDTGRLQNIITSGGIQNLSYDYDSIGNVTRRTDGSTGHGFLSESFNAREDYDELNRIKSSIVSGIKDVSYDYDDLGNITNKTGVGRYSYDYLSNPHRITRIDTLNFGYDGNGNLKEMYKGTSKNKDIRRSFTYNVYNMPTSVTNNDLNSNAEFVYDPSLELIKQKVTVNGNTTQTIYIGGLFEKVSTGSLTEYKHYIMAGGEAVAIHTTWSNSTPARNFYLHKDLLGSITAVTDDDLKNGTSVDKMSYDAFGNRRDAATWDWGKIPSIVDIVKLSTRLGFTGHIQLDEVGLIHMKGRIYDPWIGRFISPDPTVKYPYNSQSLNRYSYCLNNPLRYIDPSGFTEESTSGGTTAPDSITSTDGMGGESSGPSFGDMGGVPETKSTDPTDVGQDSSDKMKGLGEDSTPQNKKKDQKKDRSAGEDGQVNNQDIGGKGTGKEINLGLENRLPEVEKDVTLGDIIKSPFVGNPPLPNGEPEVRYHGDSAEDCAKAAVDTIIEKGKPIVIDKAKEAIKPATDAIKEKGKEVYNNNKALSIVSGVVMGTAYLCYKYSQDESVSVSGSISAGGWDIGISGNTDFKSSHGFSVSFSHGF